MAPCNVQSCDVQSCNVQSWDVQSCDVQSWDVQSWDVQSCDVQSCDVQSCDVLSCDVQSCDAAPCDVQPCHDAYHGPPMTSITEKHQSPYRNLAISYTSYPMPYIPTGTSCTCYIDTCFYLQLHVPICRYMYLAISAGSGNCTRMGLALSIKVGLLYTFAPPTPSPTSADLAQQPRQGPGLHIAGHMVVSLPRV